jgi:dienelactone hydrolase
MKNTNSPEIVKISLLMILIFCRIGFVSAQPEKENLNVFERWIEWSDGRNMLIHELNRQAFTCLDSRDREIAALKTREDWIGRQKKVKDILMKVVGPFPEKTPLNAKVTGIVKKDGYRIEKVMYESMPDLFVTACLFIPDGIKGKNMKPAIIQVSGHGFPAFRSPGTQKQLYNLVKKGFIVFAIDPFGQGERIQYWDNDKKASMLGTSPTSEHSYFGDQMFISGISPIRYFVWDGIRGVDYLLTRKEVDPERIGIFGCSGGGTQTTFISALDERIKAAVPGCYITGFRRLLESIGPQDAEQNIYHGIINGITHADLLELRAPKPLLISSTTRDFFSIQGAIETFSEVRSAYKAFGKEEDAGQVFDDAGHGFNRNITAIYAFFQKVFGVPGSSDEADFEGFRPEELQVTPTGQLSTSAGGETGFSINEKESQKLLADLKASRGNINSHMTDVVSKAKELSGFVEPSHEMKSVFRGRYQRDGYAVEMYALQGEGNYVVPLLLFVPKSGTAFPGIIYLHPKGKIADAQPGGKIEQLVKKGYIVAAPDLIGTGEVGQENLTGSGYVANMIGRSIPGIEAGDVIRVANFLKSLNNLNANKISAIAFDNMCPALLHAAVFDKSINSIILCGGLISYRSIVSNRFYDRSYPESTVAGALTSYDLPDLIGCMAPRKVGIVDVRDQLKKPAPAALIDDEFSFPVSVFNSKNASGNLKIMPSAGDIDKAVDWCMK